MELFFVPNQLHAAFTHSPKTTTAFYVMFVMQIVYSWP